MAIFKKRGKKTTDEPVESTLLDNDTDKKINKKKKIGFGKKNRLNKKDNKPQEKNKTRKKEEKPKKEDIVEKSKDTSDANELIKDIEESSDDFTKKDGKKQIIKKRKPLIQRDMSGKPVFLEDTGEKIATVYDTVYDSNKHIIGYKIKDNKSDSILTFPPDQFTEDRSGLIFVPSWFNKATKTIEKLEFKEKVSPELTTLLSDDEISNEELYQIFVKHDDQMANYIEEAVSLKELLIQRLKVLEKQRLALKNELMDLTEKRLINDIDRRDFSENVMEHRRKVNVLDVNISKCKELIQRLEKTSFGKLGDHIIANSEGNISNPYEQTQSEKPKETYVFDNQIENPYRQKYDDLKQRYEKLLGEHEELKNAVEKLIAKDEL